MLSTKPPFKSSQSSVLDQGVTECGLGQSEGGSLERSMGLPSKATDRSVVLQVSREGRYYVDSQYCNDDGEVRLRKVQQALKSNWIDLDELREIFDAWVSHDEGFVIQSTDTTTFKKITVGVKCAKRGNDVYRWRVKNSLRDLEELTYLSDLTFFNKGDIQPKTRCLFVTFTYDIKRCSKDKAWENIGVEWNRCLSWLRRRYGPLSCFRAWEAFENGYPHIHAIIFFREAEFDVFYDKADQPRIQAKGNIEGSWHSFIDVTAVQSLGSSMRYLVKYLSKVHNREEVKHTTTLAMMWLYRKRAFGLSGEFLRDLRAYRLEGVMPISNKKMVQLGLDGVPLSPSRWVFLGLCSWKEILDQRREERSDLWSYELVKVPRSLVGGLSYD